MGADCFSEGIDYLRVNFKKSVPYFEWILKILNDTNSNSYYEEEYTLQKIVLPTWPSLFISYSYLGQAIPIGMYNILNKNDINKNNKIYARFDWYWSVFRLIEVGELSKNFFYDYLIFKTDENIWITRIDYRFDLFYKEEKEFPKVEDIFWANINKKTNIDRKWKGLDGLSWWSMGSKTSKRYFVRMYDKLLDIEAKNKFVLHGDFFQYKSVQRFEIQFWPSFTRWFTLNNFNYLLEKCRSLMGRTCEFDWLTFYQYSTIHDLTDYNKLRLTKTFTNLWLKFANANISPYELLFHNLKEKTVFDGEKTNKEIYEKQHKKYLKDFQNILIEYLK